MSIPPAFYQALSTTAAVINLGLLLEKGTTVLTLRSVTPPLQCSGLAVGTAGTQEIWYCRPGPKPQAGVVSQNALTACMLLNGHDLPCIVPVINISHLTLCP